MKRIKHVLFSLLCLPLFLHAQQNTISPYSSFGIGEFQSQGFALNNQMGGIGIALRSSNHLNLMNPASLSGLNLTSFEVALSGSVVTLNDANLSQEAFSSNMAYLSLGFPIAKGFGLSGGLLPYTYQGYELSQNSVWISDTDTMDTHLDYIGSGGIHRAYINFGVQLFKGLSVGATGNMIFGTLNQKRDFWSDEPNFINRRDEYLYTVKDLSFDAGLQYHTTIKNRQLTFGATFSPESQLSASNEGSIHTYNVVNDFEYVRDTVEVFGNSTDGLTLPMNYGIGVALGKKSNWFISGQYEFKEWSQLSLFGEIDPQLKDASIYTLGFWWIPNVQDVHSYWKNIQYRMGFKYNSGSLSLSPLNSSVQPTDINDYSISFGLGLPLKRSNTITNIGVQLGKRGTTENNLVEEKYLKFHLAFTFNDKWFTKRKID